MFFIGEHDDHVSVFSVHSSIKVSWYGSKLVYESFFLKMGQLRPLFHFFIFSNTNMQFLQQINVNNVHPVYGARIQTHNLWNMRLLP